MKRTDPRAAAMPRAELGTMPDSLSLTASEEEEEEEEEEGTAGLAPRLEASPAGREEEEGPPGTASTGLRVGGFLAVSLGEKDGIRQGDGKKLLPDFVCETKSCIGNFNGSNSKKSSSTAKTRNPASTTTCFLYKKPTKVLNH